VGEGGVLTRGRVVFKPIPPLTDGVILSRRDPPASCYLRVCRRYFFQYPSTATLPIPDRDAASCGGSSTNPVGRPPAYCRWTRCARLPDEWRGAPHPLALAKVLPPRGPVGPFARSLPDIHALWLTCYGTQSGAFVYYLVSGPDDPADLLGCAEGVAPHAESTADYHKPRGAPRGTPLLMGLSRADAQPGVLGPGLLLRRVHDVAPWRTRGWRQGQHSGKVFSNR